MRNVIVINGLPRVGKDTAVATMRRLLGKVGWDTAEFSSIEPVRSMLRAAGIDLSAKTEVDRALLAEVGDALERHSLYRTRKCVEECNNFFFGVHHAAIFIHMREPQMIQKLRAALAATDLDVAFTTCLIESPRAERVTSNGADAGVLGMRYDYLIKNDGTLVQLRDRCHEFLTWRGLTVDSPLISP